MVKLKIHALMYQGRRAGFRCFLNGRGFHWNTYHRIDYLDHLTPNAPDIKVPCYADPRIQGNWYFDYPELSGEMKGTYFFPDFKPFTDLYTMLRGKYDMSSDLTAEQGLEELEIALQVYAKGYGKRYSTPSFCLDHVKDAINLCKFMRQYFKMTLTQYDQAIKLEAQKSIKLGLQRYAPNTTALQDSFPQLVKAAPEGVVPFLGLILNRHIAWTTGDYNDPRLWFKM